MSEFKAKAAEWLRRLSDSGAPVVIPQNGKAAAVLLSQSEYDALTERSRFVEAVEQGLADAEAKRIRPHDDVVADLRQRFGEPE